MTLITTIRSYSRLPPPSMGDPALCITATVSDRFAGPRATLFQWFLDLDISRVLTGYGPLPAVNRTTTDAALWGTPGQRRTLEMSRGIRAVQEITVCQPPEFYAYRVTGFTHLLHAMAHGAEARWWFDEAGPDHTDVRWSYTFWPRSRPAKLVMYPVVSTVWRRYMAQTIAEMKTIAEREMESATIEVSGIV